MAGNRPLWRWIGAGAAGLLAGLALPPWGCPPLLWLALVPVWALGPGLAALWGGAAVLVSHRWLLWLHPLDWVGVPLPLSLPLCLMLWASLGVVAAALVGGWRLLLQRLGPERFSSACLAAALWGLTEIVLAKGPLFWIGLGSAALPGDRALAGWAQWIGAGGLAALQLLLAWWLWRWLAAWAAQRSGVWRSAGAWLLVVVLLHAWGWRLLQSPRPAAASAGSLKLLVLQPAIPTREKFSWSQQQALLRRLAGAQLQAERQGADALVLPEGALSVGQSLPHAAQVEVLSGGFRDVDGALRSAVLRFEPGQLDPAQAIDKHRLVPLGEWIPGGRWLSWAGLSAVGGVSFGEPSRLLVRPAGAVGVAICYEIADGSALAAAARDGAGWLLASANLDPYPAQLQGQFAALAQLRAIETGRWLVSAANTGPSLLVDSTGAVRQRLSTGRAGTLSVQLQVRAGLTGYSRTGELPLLLLAAAAGTARQRSRVRQS
jgi:apolipoprotein N-acyltransferase